MQYGHFDDANREYVVTRPDIPVSWTNYLGTKDFASVISHNAGGYSFFKRAQQHRITRFRPNGVPLDRPGHYVYLRDDDSADYWSISWQPVGKPLDQAQYECRHGLSYSRFTAKYKGIEASQTLFIPLNDDAELWDVRIKNTGDKPRNISAFSYLEWSFHEIGSDNQNYQYSLYTSGTTHDAGVIEYDFFYDPKVFHYFAGNFQPDGFDCLRDSFIGNYRTETNPIGVESGKLTGSFQKSGNHCAALQKKLVLKPGEERRLVFMLGVGDRQAGKRMQAKYNDPAAVDKAFAELKAYWEAKLAHFQVKTPNAGLNSMINTWTPFQAETTVVWSRFASFVETGGRTGLGYRDTAQDVMSVPHNNPVKVRSRIIDLLRAQVQAGYGLHLFEPEYFDPANAGGKEAKFRSPTLIPGADRAKFIHGIEDVCSDDALWLIPSICEYVKETGDKAFFDEKVTYADGGEGTVYEHLKKALDFSSEQVGATGICKGLRADWNDCLNLGGGESAMTSFLHYWALQVFVEATQFLGRKDDEAKYTAEAKKVQKACEDNLWDGDWYIRGLTAKGAKIGTKTDKEGKVHLESNSLAVLSGASTGERAEKAVEAIDKYLYSPYGIHLVSPAYETPNDDIGFVTKVYKGVKENGAIFSHPNPWAIIAAARIGHGDQAMKFYDSLNPYNQNDKIEVRQAEPYSYVQFIYGKDHPLHGQARHPWLTGTAGWAYGAAMRWILGLRLGYDNFIVDPCVPASWKQFSMTRQWKGATFNISVENPSGVQKGVVKATLNGKPLQGPVPAQPHGSTNTLVITMGVVKGGKDLWNAGKGELATA
jgi:N,N'-diacetylchitobiose phosphorylase